MIDVEARIREHVMATCKLAAPPPDDARLVSCGYIPSVRLLELVGFLETTFAIELRPVDLLPAKLVSIASIAAVVRGRLQ